MTSITPSMGFGSTQSSNTDWYKFLPTTKTNHKLTTEEKKRSLQENNRLATPFIEKTKTQSCLTVAWNLNAWSVWIQEHLMFVVSKHISPTPTIVQGCWWQACGHPSTLNLRSLNHYLCFVGFPLVVTSVGVQDWSPHMSFILKGSQISALQLKGWFKFKTSIQEYKNEI